ncbi:MAG: flavodoxin domain-containing protein [Anaerolineae bacterium]|nr:flavodoxin domain-containing protein [Anaerolineae bacterium]
MSTLVVYDSLHGNTEKIARTVAGVLGADAQVVRAGQADPAAVAAADLVVLGAPTHGDARRKRCRTS